MGWSYLSSVVDECIDHEVRRGRKVLFLITYHFSRGDKHRGCAGHDYDKKKAIQSVIAFKEQIERIYGADHRIVCPVICGFETDFDALILHGDNGGIADLSELEDSSETNVKSLLTDIFRKMPQDILRDFVPLVQGNIRHIAEIKTRNRAIIDVQHKESVLAVGRGFDWLHEPNRALVIGPYQPNLDDAIRVGLKVILSNFEGRRIQKKDGFIALASATYVEAGVKGNRAKERAIFLKNMIKGIIDNDFPVLRNLAHLMAVITDLNTQKIEEV